MLNLDYAHSQRQAFLRPKMGWQGKLTLCFLAFACILILATEAFGETVTFQSSKPDTKCPLPHPDATMAVSLWNVGGFPLWRVTCWYKEKK
jgi:hypothetical protein